MPLAGQMRLKTFLAFALPILAAVVFAGGWWIKGQMEERERVRAYQAEQLALQIAAERKAQEAAAEERRVREEQAAAERREREAAAAAKRAEREATIAHLAEHERDLILNWAQTDLRAKKRKDVSRGKPWKINVYQDAGNATVNRAKVDLDRDGPESMWDEKWTFGADGSITRKRSTRDDGTYDVEETFDGTNWVN